MMREFKPVESFFTLYLTSPPVNLSTDDVNEKVYPTGTYAAFFYTIILILVTDYLKYKPLIIMDGLYGILTYSLLLGNVTMLQLYFEQMFYGFTYASEIVCDTYLYVKIKDTSQFQRLTGYVRASCLTGRCISSVFGQVVITSGLNKSITFLLPYCTISVMTFNTIWTFAIPSVDCGLYFHRPDQTQEVIKNVKTEDKHVGSSIEDSFQICKEEKVMTSRPPKTLCNIGKHIWSDFKTAYTDLYILKWSVWWSYCLAGSYFVQTYSQVLWQTIVDEKNNHQLLLNGGVDSASALLGALLAYGISNVNFPWRRHGNWILCLNTGILSILVFLSAYSNSLVFIYSAYVTFNGIFQAMLTIAQSEVSQNLEKDSYALVFGFNNLMAFAFCSIITYTVIEGNITTFRTREQFLFYSIYYLVMAIIVLLEAIVLIFSSTLEN